MADNERDDFPTSGAIQPTPTGPTPMPMNTGTPMEVESAKTSAFITKFLVVFLATLFFTMVMVLAFRELPKDSKDLFNYALVGVAGLLAIIVNYQYGSSSASKAKDDTISRILR